MPQTEFELVIEQPRHFLYDSRNSLGFLGSHKIWIAELQQYLTKVQVVRYSLQRQSQCRGERGNLAGEA